MYSLLGGPYDGHQIEWDDDRGLYIRMRPPVSMREMFGVGLQEEQYLIRALEYKICRCCTIGFEHAHYVEEK